MCTVQTSAASVNPHGREPRDYCALGGCEDNFEFAFGLDLILDAAWSVVWAADSGKR